MGDIELLEPEEPELVEFGEVFCLFSFLLSVVVELCTLPIEDNMFVEPELSDAAFSAMLEVMSLIADNEFITLIKEIALS